MSRHAESDQDRASYRTFDDRMITGKFIDRVLHDIEVQARRERRLSLMRSWILAVLLTALLAGGFAYVAWSHALMHF